jgi:hypothetical protein
LLKGLTRQSPGEATAQSLQCRPTAQLGIQE